MDDDRWCALKVGDRIALLRPDGSRDPKCAGVIVERHGDDPIFVVKRDTAYGFFRFSFPHEFVKL